MPTINSANVANAIVKLVAADALPALVGNLVLGNLVNRSFEPVLAQAGDTVNVPIPPTLVANNLAEGGSVQSQNPSLGNAQIVLNTHAEATFIIPDVTQAITVPDLFQVYMQPAIIAIAEKIETDLASLYPGFISNGATGGSSLMDEARIDLAETELFAAKVPDDGRRYLVVSGTAYGQLRQLPRFTELQTAAAGLMGNANAIQTGQVGKIKSFNVFRSQYIQKPSGTTFNMAFHPNAMGLVVRRLPLPLPGTGAIAHYAEMGNFGMRVTMSYQPNTLSQQFTVDVLYGAAVLRQTHGVQVQTN